MGGAAPTPGGKGGKKPVDAAINLVPFIDLLSCCLSFLLITAVWTQLARMDVQQKGQGAAGAESENKDPQVQLTLYIDKDGYTFAKSTGESTPIPMKGEDYDYAKLGEILTKAKTDHPDKTDIAVKSDDSVIYSRIIHTMDVAVGAQFKDIGLQDKGQGN
ncbi:MAG: biopolymer transporter ExbD [Myxococcales bacterium]|nr:biopolymer transporter ExbD [Myxococcales bacterium]